MKKSNLITILNDIANDNAECLIAENPKCLMIKDKNVCYMIKLDGDW